MPLPPLDRLSRSASTGMITFPNEHPSVTLGRAILALEEAWRDNEDQARNVTIDVMHGNDDVLFKFEADRPPGGPTAIEIVYHAPGAASVDYAFGIEPQFDMNPASSMAKVAEIAAVVQATFGLGPDDWVRQGVLLTALLYQAATIIAMGPTTYVDRTTSAGWDHDDDEGREKYTAEMDEVTIEMAGVDAANFDIRLEKTIVL